GDVSLMSAYVSGTSQPRLPPIPAGLTINSTGPDPTLSVPVNLVAVQGAAITIPVEIDTAKPQGSTGLMEAVVALRYDPRVFTVSAADVHLGTVPTSVSGWRLITAVNSQTGEIGIDLFGATPISSPKGGSLVTLTLHVNAAAPPGPTMLNLVRQVNPTGRHAYVTAASDSQGTLVLHPAVTDGVDVGVDGQVTVSKAPDSAALAQVLANLEPPKLPLARYLASLVPALPDTAWSERLSNAAWDQAFSSLAREAAQMDFSAPLEGAAQHIKGPASPRKAAIALRNDMDFATFDDPDSIALENN
ncbi:MAG TPA: hypothetical protein VE988_12015, partial [Gemmataceae bacterium]|nr:hypothetical protein [Gemmataceae bacterium]